MPSGNMPPPFILLSILHTRRHHPFFGWTRQSNQQKECSRVTPLGPLLFCLSIQHIVMQLESELSLFYLDDGTLGGNVDNLKHDLDVVK